MTNSEKSSATELNVADLSRVVEMAWEDRTPFDAIERLYGLTNAQVVELMRRTLKPSSFRMWRKRTAGRATKHVASRSSEVTRAYCPGQYKRF
jgi:uncharacterized protein (TIGR03643 family)